ncbi:hypothetical protein [Marinagarivorans cellulosilyticus]|uniref:3-hydroxylacyl-ACP dehydratase n=1 Tax=Marinagarivorans cellulosilyticus TaxID=2721545 RepID=A0AAN1WFU9_9GAMM|nr:hypothetical protein [Marinagarivorans cellulosilyticus]BCD96831.1 hypothetical protein MARGE09_P1031 [Marinagarivorans cellulosilyticus]
MATLLPTELPIETFLLHRKSMLLIKEITSCGDDWLEASVDVAASSLFVSEQGDVPSWVGLEYMAQAISALAGVKAWRQGRKLEVGFLLGTRRYSAVEHSFSLAVPLSVKVVQLMRDENNLVLFDCHIYRGEKSIACAEIKAIQPDDIQTVLAQLDAK